VNWPWLYQVNTQEGPRWRVDTGTGNAKPRKRYTFPSRKHAERKQAELARIYADYGRSGFMTDEDRADVLSARRKLREAKLPATLAEVTNFHLLHKKPHGGDAP
jgi:hypothetical protein